jgi:hypothetical protein
VKLRARSLGWSRGVPIPEDRKALLIPGDLPRPSPLPTAILSELAHAHICCPIALVFALPSQRRVPPGL